MSRLVLLSGGLDSAVAADMSGAKDGLFIDYGQPARVPEGRAAQAIAHKLGIILHRRSLGGLYHDIGCGIVPARNMLLISVAAMVAASLGDDEVVHGATRSDHAEFVDCRPEFFAEMDRQMRPFSISVLAPLLNVLRAEVVTAARAIGLYGLHWSCYTSGPEPCGECLSCTQ